jgi:hypothetical protein
MCLPDTKNARRYSFAVVLALLIAVAVLPGAVRAQGCTVAEDVGDDSVDFPLQDWSGATLSVGPEATDPRWSAFDGSFVNLGFGFDFPAVMPAGTVRVRVRDFEAGPTDFTLCPAPTPTPTNTPTDTATSTPTETPTSTPTFTPTATPTNTSSPTPTEIPTPTATPTPAVYLPVVTNEDTAMARIGFGFFIMLAICLMIDRVI